MKNIRQYENLHIILWLLKDACWLIKFKAGAVLMVAPTVIVALHLAWKTRHNKRLFLPNVAVCLWIAANGTWMLGEFFLFNFETPALIFFFAGILTISSFFIHRLLTYNKSDKK